MSKTVYLAGPITGLEYDGAVDWREHACKVLARSGIVGLSPMRWKTFLKDTTFVKTYGDDYMHPLATDKGITTRDRNDIMTCDAVLVEATGMTMASVGTAIELGWADAFRKPVVMVLPKAEYDANPFNHGIARSIAGYMIETLDEGLEIATALLSTAQVAPIREPRCSTPGCQADALHAGDCNV